MRRVRFKIAWGDFLSATVVLCVLSFIVVLVHAGSNSRVTLLTATVPEKNTKTQSALSESHITTEPNSPKPVETENKLAADSPDSGEWQTVRMRVTAYCPCERCCGEYADGVTACGHRIQAGDSFAAADRRYPFGTEMVVAGYNNGESIRVLDRGGAIRGNRLDLFFHSHEEALQWGVRHLDVRVRFE